MPATVPNPRTQVQGIHVLTFLAQETSRSLYCLPRLRRGVALTEAEHLIIRIIIWSAEAPFEGIRP
jgi:hypothetical protein